MLAPLSILGKELDGESSAGPPAPRAPSSPSHSRAHPSPPSGTSLPSRGPFLELREDGDPPSAQIRLSLGPCLRKVVGEKLPAALTWTGSCSPGVGGFWSGP